MALMWWMISRRYGHSQAIQKEGIALERKMVAMSEETLKNQRLIIELLQERLPRSVQSQEINEKKG